ncbi:anion permease, partial [bacterium]|nr:anion permease [bacterium]
ASFGLSAAVVDSGLAEVISRHVIGVFGGYHPWVMLAVIYLVTALSTEMLSNNAAAALILPIAIETAERVAELQGMPVDPRPYAVAVAIAASMSFITPLGYQTNLMVYGPGGYRFTDFARLGVPLAVLCFVVAMVTIPMVWQIVP